MVCIKRYLCRIYFAQSRQLTEAMLLEKIYSKEKAITWMFNGHTINELYMERILYLKIRKYKFMEKLLSIFCLWFKKNKFYVEIDLRS